ncbi:VC_2705 family sodium/solute symporter [Aliarcobacter lanthieri]|uniref:VC_2705 family sodium/solute symporter n=1 Tax=Aliarcobacter lanthieri TaxID=1355374 RepID=UPI003AFA6343
MELQSLIYLFVGVSFTIYFGLALWTKASSTKDFYIVKNSFNPIFGGASIAVDFISAVTFISLSGAFLTYGYGSIAFIIGLVGGIVILSIIIIPYLQKTQNLSIPNFLEKRFYSKYIKLISIFIVVLVSFIYISAQLKGVGIIFSRIFQLDLTTGLLIGMGITLIYAFIGGMRNMAYAQIAQYIIILFTFMTPAIFLTIEFTTTFLPQLAIFSKTSFGEELYLMQAFDRTLNDLGFKPSSDLDLINTILIAISLMFGVACLPHIVIKFFSNPSVKDARKSALWALVFISIIYTSIFSIFAISTLNIVKNTTNIEYEAFINDEVKTTHDTLNSGKWLKIWENIGLVKFKDSNKNGNIDLQNGENNFGELNINPDALALLNPEIANLPNWVIALFLAGALAATLSTITGLILIIKTTLSYELFEQSFKKNSINKVLLSKLFIVVIIVLATLFHIPNFTILQTVAIAFTLCTATLFPTLVLAIFYEKTNTQGAIIGILTALIFTLIYAIYFLYFNNSQHINLRVEGIGVIGAILNFIVTITISNLTSKIHKDVD